MKKVISPIDIEGIYRDYLDENKSLIEKKDMKVMNIGIMHQERALAQESYTLNLLK